MKSGKLRHRITIEQPSKSQGAELGEPKMNWVEFSQCWAEVKPVSGKEEFTNDQVLSETSHEVTIRYREGIRTDMRIDHKGRKLNIESIVNRGERNIELVLKCVEEHDG